MKQKTKGFSLAELLVAMFVIVVGVAGVISSIYWGLQKTDHGQYITQASNYARVISETLITRGDVKTAFSLSGGSAPPATSGVNDAATERRAIFAPPFDHLSTNYGASQGSGTIDRYRRNISVQRLAAAGASDGLGGTHTSGLARVTVKIYYDEDGTTSNDVTRFNRFVQIETIVPLN